VAKTPLERFTEKVDLIFDFSPDTPLFVRKADTELDRNNIDGAVDILKKGLDSYPDYATAHIILGKAYTLMGDYDNAHRAFQKGSMLIGSAKTLEFYGEQLENIRRHHSPFTLTRRATFIEEPEPETASEDEITFDLLEDDDLSELANRISKAKMPPPKPGETSEIQPPPADEPGGVKIYSETMGKIFMAQGNIAEAIDVFEHLAQRDPSRRTYYQAIIIDLKKKSG
jgi:tetratricopeptide (TPR) repeat protein